MWTISPLYDISRVRGGGGQPFTQFVDSLLRAQSFIYGISDSGIATTLRVNVADGGVDTRIDQGIDKDKTGWLSAPSAWQYKAENASAMTEKSIGDEIEKCYAAELVKRGFGYRVCICDELTPEKKGKLASALNEKAKGINPSASMCYVLSASDLAEWANSEAGH